MKRLFILLSAIFVYGSSLACTSAIVAAQRSTENAPILWKHRDSNFSNTRVDYVEGGKYAYTAVITNNKKNTRAGVFAGVNEVGFGAIDTNTRHLPIASPEEYEACTRPRTAKSLYRLSLASCSTVDEFEELLKTTKRKRGYKTNMGIADATGAVAYFEIWDLGYKRYDVDSSKGFDVRANYSHLTPADKKGLSTRRYNVIMRKMTAHNGNFAPQDFIRYSRSYESVKYGDVLANDKKLICASHTVPRYSTVASIVLVCDKECPRMLVTNGHPVSSVAVPVYVQAERNIPICVNGDAMRLLSNDFRAVAYTKVDKKKHMLNKDVIRKVLNIKQPEIDMPKTMPENIRAFNAAIDKKFAKHERRVRKVLRKYS